MIFRTILLIAVIAITFTSAVNAQTIGDCQIGEAEVDLDVNNVDARLYNTGSLFWRGSGNFYRAPKDSSSQSIFTLGIWLGGLDDEGKIRFAGTSYGPFEFWPGPLEANGSPPDNCAQYDRIFSIYQTDLNRLDTEGAATSDILDWPYELGAPVADGDGNPDNYNLSGGDRPATIGDQMAWWVMNDAGNEKFTEQGSLPIGLEVHVSAFAFHDSTALDNTTFYRYTFINKGSSDLSQTYFGLWTDADLGNAADDFIASDSILGLGITYNGADEDLGLDGYGDRPPALGVDFVSGPIKAVGNPDRLSATSFINTEFGFGSPNGLREKYESMQSIWRTGDHLTYGGTGFGGQYLADFMFTGNPARREFWSEENTDGNGSQNTPSERSFLLSTGPFDIPSGESQEITFAIIWSQADSRLGSYAKLIDDDIYIHGLYDRNFVPQDTIDAPVVSASAFENNIVISWENPPSSNNYLDSFDERSGFIYNKLDSDTDLTYTFEGYDIIQFESPDDSVGRVIATYDRDNAIGGLTEEVYDHENNLYVNVVAARGDNSGVQHHHTVTGVINYQDYYFGVQAYAYNERSRPMIHRGPVGRVHFIPTPVDARVDSLNASAGDRLTSMRLAGTGDENLVYATVINPSAIDGSSYTISVDSLSSDSVLVYSIVDDAGAILAQDLRLRESSARVPMFARDIVVDSGLSFSIEQLEATFDQFFAVSNAAGPIDPVTGAAADFQGFPVPRRPGSEQQVGDGVWMIHAVSEDGSPSLSPSFDSFLQTVLPGDSGIGSADIEIRFGNSPSTGYDKAAEQLIDVPFSVWNIGIATPNDSSDDYQYIVGTVDHDGNGFSLRWLDHNASGANNDPFTDQFTIFEPLNKSPGTGGYDQWLASAQSGGSLENHGPAVMRNLTLMNWNGGAIAAATDLEDYLANVVDQLMPERGTVFRMVTSKPLSDGDIFSIDASSSAPTYQDPGNLASTLENIGIVPNPYKGASAYEVGGPARRVRFTGLTNVATIRVFTMAGTLVRQIQKNDALPYVEWDLLTDEGFILGSGMYLVHVTVPGVGERVLKFGHISRAN